VMNFLMMPMFFLSGALFPLTGLPGWMTFLTRIDPASYGIDPLRRVVLSESGLPGAVIDQLGLTINGQLLPIPVEVGIMLGFGVVMLAIAVVSFKRRD
jgi:ABC-2 type transport system permease protein